MTTMAHGVFTLSFPFSFWNDNDNSQSRSRRGNSDLYFQPKQNQSEIHYAKSDSDGMSESWSNVNMVLINEIGLFTILLCLVTVAVIHRQRLSFLLSLVKIKMKQFQSRYKQQNANVRRGSKGHSSGGLKFDFWGDAAASRDLTGSPKKILYIPVRRTIDTDDEEELELLSQEMTSVSLPVPVPAPLPVTVAPVKLKIPYTNPLLEIFDSFTPIKKYDIKDEDEDDDKYFSSSEVDLESVDDVFDHYQNQSKIMLLGNNNPPKRKSILKRRASQQLSDLVDQLPQSEPDSLSPLTLASKYNLRERQPVHYYPGSTSTPSSSFKKLLHNISNCNTVSARSHSLPNQKKKVKFGRTFTIVYKRDL